MTIIGIVNKLNGDLIINEYISPIKSENPIIINKPVI
jgi:hypothetical protein